jgi:hypothetical protein
MAMLTLTVAAIASLGAGAIHATAAGAHSEHPAAAAAFVLTAVAQLGWGAYAFARPGRRVALLGAAVNAAAVGGWLLAKTAGIGFVAGLDTSESVGFPDALAAGFAMVAVAGALATLAPLAHGRASLANPALIGIAAIATVALAIPGMLATGRHSHDDGSAGGHDHEALAPPVPYLATLPVDLGGVPGVSEQEVTEAEALVTASLQALPRFADIPALGPWATTRSATPAPASNTS